MESSSGKAFAVEKLKYAPRGHNILHLPGIMVDLARY
jgi:hypothetical protein